MRDNVLFDLLKKFIFSAIPIVNKAIDDRYFKPKYDKYPTLKYRDNGMPDISEYGVYPLKISDLFYSYSGKSDIEVESINNYNEIFNYLLNHAVYKEFNYFEHGTIDDSERFFKNITQIFLIDILERYYLLNKTKENNEQLLELIFQPIENYVYSKELNFDLSAPILFTRFDFDEFFISENVLIRRISDENNLARYSIRSYSPPVTSTLISCATHEIVLKNYHAKKPKRYVEVLFSEETIYPHDKFELFFNSLKIISNINTGYAQVIVYPHDWAEHYSMDLSYLTGTSVKRYPNFFDNFYWNTESLPMVKSNEITMISELFLKLDGIKNNKIRISNKRLRYSYLRDNEDDSILDIIIALETLLSDGDKGEITHKLSLRIAKLLDIYSQGYDPVEVFESVKKIYSFRSAIVHGSDKVDSKREIKVPNITKSIRTIVLANNYLREIIKILIYNPIYLNPIEIDKLLIKNTLPNKGS